MTSSIKRWNLNWDQASFVCSHRYIYLQTNFQNLETYSPERYTPPTETVPDAPPTEAEVQEQNEQRADNVLETDETQDTRMEQSQLVPDYLKTHFTQHKLHSQRAVLGGDITPIRATVLPGLEEILGTETIEAEEDTSFEKPQSFDELGTVYEALTPDAVEALQGWGFSENEQLALDEVQVRIDNGEALTEDDEQLVQYLGKKLENQGAEKVKANIVSQYPGIPQIADMTPNEAVKFVEQYEKVSAVYKHFQSVEDETGILYGARNWFSETFKGKSLLEGGEIGQGLEKLKSGQALSEEEMSVIDGQMENLDEEAKVQMYQKVVADMLERMVPGVNIAKDGFTGEALTADAINTISVLAMLVTGGGSLVARVGINAQRVANGILKADVGATMYGFGEGVVGMTNSIESGNKSGMALSGSMMIMSILGLKAGMDGQKFVGNPQRMEMMENYQRYAQETRGKNLNPQEIKTVNEIFKAWNPRFRNALPEETAMFERNIGHELVQAQGQVAKIFKGMEDRWTLMGSGAVNKKGLKRDDVDVNFAITDAPAVRRNLEQLKQEGKVFVQRLDEKKKPVIGADNQPIFDAGFDGKPMENGTPRFAFWVEVKKADGTTEMMQTNLSGGDLKTKKEVEMFGEGIRPADGKTIGITQITALPDVSIIRHKITLDDGSIVTVNQLNKAGVRTQYAYNLVSEIQGDTLQALQKALAEGKSPKAKDLMRFEKLRELGAGSFDEMKELIEKASARFNQSTVAKEYKEVFGNRQNVYDLMERSETLYKNEKPLRGRPAVDSTEAQRYLDDFPTLFDDLGDAKLDITRSFDSLGSADSIEALHGNFARVRDQLAPFENLNQHLRKVRPKPKEGALHFMATERFFSDFVHDYARKARRQVKRLKQKALSENRELSANEVEMRKEIEDMVARYKKRTISVNSITNNQIK